MKTVALGKVAKIDRTVANDDECLSLPYVGLEHVEKERGHFADGFVPTPLHMLATNFRFTPKHVLYGKLRPYLNKVVLPSFDGVCTTEILPILPNEEKLDRTFLWAILLSPTFVNWATSQISGANLPRLDPKLLAEYEIPLPPLTEQKRIASLLARADRLRHLRRTAHDLGDALLQSVFLEMFGDVRFPEIPLSELCSFITKGTTPQSSDINNYASEIDDVPFLKVYHLTNNGKVDFDYSPTWVSNSIHNGLLNRSKVYPNDVLMNIVGPPLGKFGIVPASYPEWNVNQAIAIFRAKKQILPIYLLHALRYPKTLEKMINQAVGVRQLNLSLEQCRDFRIPVPPLSLQEEFAGVVARVESLRGRMGESTRQVDGLFESLLAEAFNA